MRNIDPDCPHLPQWFLKEHNAYREDFQKTFPDGDSVLNAHSFAELYKKCSELLCRRSRPYAEAIVATTKAEETTNPARWQIAAFDYRLKIFQFSGKCSDDMRLELLCRYARVEHLCPFEARVLKEIRAWVRIETDRLMFIERIEQSIHEFMEVVD